MEFGLVQNTSKNSIMRELKNRINLTRLFERIKNRINSKIRLFGKIKNRINSKFDYSKNINRTNSKSRSIEKIKNRINSKNRLVGKTKNRVISKLDHSKKKLRIFLSVERMRSETLIQCGWVEIGAHSNFYFVTLPKFLPPITVSSGTSGSLIVPSLGYASTKNFLLLRIRFFAAGICVVEGHCRNEIL